MATFNPATGQYTDADGAVVPVRAIRDAVRVVVDDSADRLQVLAERFRDGQLDTIGWREAIRGELRTSYGVTASLARGGVERMDPSARGKLGSELRTAYGFADQFALQVNAGDVDPASDAFLARARMYSGGAHSTYYVFAQREARARGEDEERRVLGSSASCDDCIGYADQGWQPIGSLPAPGQESQCLSNCACELETRTAAEAAVEA